MSNKNLPAFPVEISFSNNGKISGVQTGDNSGWEAGLSKREYIAAKVLPECIEMFSPMNPQDAAKAAVQYADALLTELEK
jgi:hypothetical protein